MEAYNKAVSKFEQNPRAGGLHYEVMKKTAHLKPKLRSFRINDTYRVEGYELGSDFVPINVTKHYDD